MTPERDLCRRWLEVVMKVVEVVRKVAFVPQDYSLQPRHGQSSHAYRSNAFRETS